MNNKCLFVGDMHVQIKNLKDAGKLIDFIIKTAEDNNIKCVEFLGDIQHTHAILRIEVVDFWKKAFDKIEKAGIGCVVLVGNHDQPGSKEKEQEMNSVNIFTSNKSPNASNARIIANKPMIIEGIAYVPYYSDEEAFLKAAQDLYDQGATELLVAHQTFTGAQYENGFFSEEGIDPALIPQEQIISGHIHKTQQVGKCFYPGTPKWDTMADANQEKGIWIFTHEEGGGYSDSEFISTKEIVTPITSYSVKEGDELPKLNPSARNHVILEGKSAWITKAKKKFKDIAQIKVIPTDRKVKLENKDDTATLENYLDRIFEPIEGIDKKDIKEHLVNL